MEVALLLGRLSYYTIPLTRKQLFLKDVLMGTCFFAVRHNQGQCAGAVQVGRFLQVSHHELLSLFHGPGMCTAQHSTDLSHTGSSAQHSPAPSQVDCRHQRLLNMKWSLGQDQNETLGLWQRVWGRPQERGSASFGKVPSLQIRFLASGKCEKCHNRTQTVQMQQSLRNMGRQRVCLFPRIKDYQSFKSRINPEIIKKGVVRYL